MSENAEAWELWKYMNTQWRVGDGGLVGLDYTAVSFLADNLDIDMTPATLKKIKALESYMLQHQAEEVEKRGS